MAVYQYGQKMQEPFDPSVLKAENPSFTTGCSMKVSDWLHKQDLIQP